MKKRFVCVLLTLCILLPLLPTTALAAERSKGWYTFSLGDTNKSYVTIGSGGNAVLRTKGATASYYIGNEGKFYLEYANQKNERGESAVTLKMPDGRYLGISSGAIKNGTRLRAVDSPFLWVLPSQAGGLRPFAKRNMVANASGESYKSGTNVILWQIPKSTSGFAPKHAAFSSLSAIDPEGIEFGLYRVAGDTATQPQPLYKAIGGAMIDVVPGKTILEVIKTEGDWVKVKFKGREYYMNMYYRDKWRDEGKFDLFSLFKVDRPDIVASPWAKAWLTSYVITQLRRISPETRPITR